MVASGYAVEQTIYFLVLIPCFIFSVVEIVASYSLKAVLLKQRIHFICATAAFSIILSSIDPSGGLHLLPPVSSVVTDTTWNMLFTGGLGLIIYSHFQAHFITLRKQPPQWLPKLMCGIFGITFPLNHVCAGMEWASQKMVWRAVQNASSMVLVSCFLVCEWFGYFLIRKMILETKAAQIRPTTASQNHPNRSQKKSIDYDFMLCHIIKFHAIATVGIIIFFIMSIQGISSALQKKDHPPQYRDPDNFSFSPNLGGFVFLYCLETWWGWVPLGPLCGRQEGDSQTSRSGLSKTKHPDLSNGPISPYKKHSLHSRSSPPQSKGEHSLHSICDDTALNTPLDTPASPSKQRLLYKNEEQRGLSSSVSQADCDKSGHQTISSSSNRETFFPSLQSSSSSSHAALETDGDQGEKTEKNSSQDQHLINILPSTTTTTTTVAVTTATNQGGGSSSIGIPRDESMEWQNNQLSGTET